MCYHHVFTSPQSGDMSHTHRNIFNLPARRGRLRCSAYHPYSMEGQSAHSIISIHQKFHPSAPPYNDSDTELLVVTINEHVRRQ